MRTDIGGADAKPRLLLFRRLRRGLPAFVEMHLHQQVACLAKWFDVTVVEDNCDYQQMCDRHRPDLALFESGVYTDPAHEIRNTRANSDVPKLGFLHADAYCASRTRFINDMNHWDIGSFVTISVSMGEYTPELADDLFVWPNFVDTHIFRDYGLPKVVPVLFTGSQAAHYPWRIGMSKVLAGQYPTMTAPHHGWFEGGARMAHGVGYARMLNAAQIVPSCGTIAKELVRKHLEIPASRACLVAERTAALEAAGFVDMQNCVFADEADVLDKLDHLFKNPDELARITDAGRDLVLARHTSDQRDQIAQWYRLNVSLRAGERIVQPGPFAPLEIVPAGGTAARNAHVISTGRDRELLDRARAAAERGEFDQARRLYQRCLDFHFIAEAAIGLAQLSLREGKPRTAIGWTIESIDVATRYHRTEPDPVEWAVFLRAQVLSGRLRHAIRFAGEHLDLHHQELERIRYVIAALAGRAAQPVPSGTARSSLHEVPLRTWADWIAELAADARAAGRKRLAARIGGLPAPESVHGACRRAAPDQSPRRGGDLTQTSRRMRPLRDRVVGRARRELRRVRGVRPTDGFATAVATLLTTQTCRSVVVASGGASDQTLHRLCGVLSGHPDRPQWVFIESGARGQAHRRMHSGVSDFTAVTVAEARAQGLLDRPDLLVIMGRPDCGLTPAEIRTARHVALSEVKAVPRYNLRRLLQESAYDLVDVDVDLGSFAIYRQSRQNAEANR